MITTRVRESTPDQPLKVVHFFDSNNNYIRANFYDKDVLILDEMYEYLDSQRAKSYVLFTDTSYKATMYSEFLYNDNGFKIGEIEYKLVDDHYEKINYAVYEYTADNKPLRRIQYDKNGNFCFYQKCLQFEDSSRVYADDEEYYDENDQLLYTPLFFEQHKEFELIAIFRSNILLKYSKNPID